MIRGRHQGEEGAVSKLLISTILLALLFAVAASAAVWGIMNYMSEKTDVDVKIQSAVATAQKTQADADEVKFNQREKEPYTLFVGPDDYGRLTFTYPKTWSVYVAKNVTNPGDTFQAYINPVSVPPISTIQQYAVRVTIQTGDISTVLTQYAGLVKSGKLQSSTSTINGETATRLDGSFTANIRGAAVIFKIRDKTVTIQTDADTFKPDFETLVTSIKFNQ